MKLGAPPVMVACHELSPTLLAEPPPIALEPKEHIEYEARYERANGYDSLTVAFQSR